MKRTVVDAAGDVRCPKCGARNAFTSKRTGKAKVIGVAAVGVGAVAMPKRLQCQGCGSYLKPGAASVRRAATKATPRQTLIVWGCIIGFFALFYLISLLGRI